jgi:hypothetical protein
VALCCVALPFARSADFAADKPAGVPCRHLAGNFTCTIHDRLRSSGYAGCTAFDCFGAGQRLTQQIHTGRDWRGHPELAGSMFEAFEALRILHELLWYLQHALDRAAAGPVHPELREAAAHTETLAAKVSAAAEAKITAADAAAQRAAIAPLLRRASALVRGPDAADRTGADLAGRDLRRTDLRRTSLRGALLLGADLRGVELDRTDLLGADLRGADLRGADLRTALFVTRPQLAAARGDAATCLPDERDRPGHWPATGPLATPRRVSSPRRG